MSKYSIKKTPNYQIGDDFFI